MSLLHISPTSVSIADKVYDDSAPFVYKRNAFVKYMMPIYRERSKILYEMLNAARLETNTIFFDLQTNMVSKITLAGAYKPSIQAFVVTAKADSAIISSAAAYYSVSTTLYDDAVLFWDNDVVPELSTPLSDSSTDADILIAILVSTLTQMLFHKVEILSKIVNRLNGTNDGIGLVDLSTLTTISGARPIDNINDIIPDSPPILTITDTRWFEEDVVTSDLTLTGFETLDELRALLAAAQPPLLSSYVGEIVPKIDFILSILERPAVTSQEVADYTTLLSNIDAAESQARLNAPQVRLYSDGTMLSPFAGYNGLPVDHKMTADYYYYFKILDVESLIAARQQVAGNIIDIAINNFGLAADIVSKRPFDKYNLMVYELFFLVFPDGVLHAVDKPRVAEITSEILTKAQEAVALTGSTYDRDTNITVLQSQITLADLNNPVDTTLFSKIEYAKPEPFVYLSEGGPISAYTDGELTGSLDPYIYDYSSETIVPYTGAPYADGDFTIYLFRYDPVTGALFSPVPVPHTYDPGAAQATSVSIFTGEPVTGVELLTELYSLTPEQYETYSAGNYGGLLNDVLTADWGNFLVKAVEACVFDITSAFMLHKYADPSRPLSYLAIIPELTDASYTIVYPGLASPPVTDAPLMPPTSEEVSYLTSLLDTYGIDHSAYLSLQPNITLFNSADAAPVTPDEMEITLNRSANWYLIQSGDGATHVENWAPNATMIINTAQGSVTLNNSAGTGSASLMSTYTETPILNTIILQ